MFEGAPVPRTQRVVDESPSSVFVEQPMLKATFLPTPPRVDTRLNVGWQILKIVPELNDRLRCGLPVTIADGTFSRMVLDKLSDEIRAFPMVI